MRFGSPEVRVRSVALEEQPEGDGVLDEWYVVDLRGREALSQLYELEVTVQTSARFGAPYPTARVEELLGASFLVQLTQEVADDADEGDGRSLGAVHGALMHGFHGVLREVEMRSTERADAADDAASEYRAVLVPRLWYTTQSVRTRLFQGMSVPEVIAHILKELGLDLDKDFEFRLAGVHMQREYTMQYRESDFAFISRLAEHEGISFFFEQLATHEKVVFGDHNEAFQEYVTLKALATEPGDARFEHLRYDPRRAVVNTIPCLKTLRRTFRQGPRSVAVLDYDPKAASVDVHAAAEVHPGGIGMRVYHQEAKEYSRTGGPDDVAPQVDRLAPVRAQELRAGRDVLSGDSTALGLFSGMTFTLQNHPDAELVWRGASGDRRRAYFVTEAAFSLRQAGTGDEGNHDFTAQIRFVDAETPWRPARTTPRPVVAGVMTAKVADMAKDSPADLDEHGQYSVILDVPTVGAPEMKGATLRRMRMAQPFSGPGYGMHHPLHEGAEVLLAHLNGDPDRPVIVGSPHNFDNASPVTSRNATLGGVRTRNRVIDYVNDDA